MSGEMVSYMRSVTRVWLDVGTDPLEKASKREQSTGIHCTMRRHALCYGKSKYLYTYKFMNPDRCSFYKRSILHDIFVI